MLRHLAIAAVLACTPVASFAQEETLADIRQQLSILYVDITRLKRELSTTGTASGNTGGGSTPLDRLNTIEAELQRLTSKTEQLEFRVNRITVDGTNRIGDLEFRLCELEANCDIGQLGDTPSLGGVDNGAGVPTAAAPPVGGPALAVGEQSDFERAQEALASGDFRSAADLLETFAASYPGSPLSGQVQIARGKALEGLGEKTRAARAYLEAFSGNPDGAEAPEALFRLGRALGNVGQTQDACVTLAEVGVRFPGNPNVAEAQNAMAALGCS